MDDDKRTLALVLGASEFPYSPTLASGEAFENSAHDFRRYLYDPTGLNLPPADVLNLFDDDRPPSELLRSVGDFLRKRQSKKHEVKGLLVYYVGHGGFTAAGQDFLLAVQSTRVGSEGFTSIRITDLSQIIKDSARFLCRYLIFDCCFSAQAYAAFQSGPGEAAVTKTMDSVPSKGTALLCSSGPKDVSLAPQGCEHTMFSEALLNVLKAGDPKLGEYISLYQVRDLIDWQLRDTYEDSRVRPQIHGPNQPEGDVSHTPLFPNPAYKLSSNSPSGDWRRVIVSDDSLLQFPAELTSALGNSLPSVRLAALSEIVELYKVTPSRKIAALAKAEILQLSETDDSTRVRNSARDALAECVDIETRERPTTAVEKTVTSPFPGDSSKDKPTLGDISDLEGLNLFLEATWKLNSSEGLDEVLYILLDAALRLTHMERSFVFLAQGDGQLRLAAGLRNDGEHTADDSTIAKSMLREAANRALEFLLTGNDNTGNVGDLEHMIAHGLHSVICIPLSKTFISKKEVSLGGLETQGVLYLDSHLPSERLSAATCHILRTIAKTAATMVENAALIQVEDAAKRYRQELAIAGDIQQRLMTVTVPDVPYAKVNAASYACKDIGGDFFDLVYTEQGLSLIVADVSGKGIAAAVVASMLQGMLYSQLARDSSLPEMMASVNRFLTEKVAGQKYATLVVARLEPKGVLEIMNCGAVAPLLVSGGSVTKLEEGNLPIGLVPGAEFSSSRFQMNPGDRLVLITDGVTEAEDANGEFFGMERLDACAQGGLVAIEQAVTKFRGDTGLTDDFTITEMTYRGSAG